MMTAEILLEQTLSAFERKGNFWRPADKRDAPAIFQMRLACDQADGTDHAATVAILEREFEDPWVGDVEKDTILVLTSEGEVAACGMVYANPEPVEVRRAFLWFAVHPLHRAGGLENAVLAWLEARGSRVLQNLPFPLPCALQTGSQDTLTGRMALCEARGYQDIRNFYRMMRDLKQPLQDPQIPEGIILRHYSPELDQALMEAFNLSFADHWDFEPITEEDWRLWFVNPDVFSPDLTYIVMAGDEIAAFAMNGVSEEENQRRGVKEGWIHGLGTRREWRRRGLASALLNASMGAFKRAGLEYATLGVDTENTTGALGLYERLGFNSVKRYIRYSKQIECV